MGVKNGSIKGDFQINIRVKIPKQLSAKQKQLY